MLAITLINKKRHLLSKCLLNNMCLSEKTQQNDGKRADETVATLEDLIQKQCSYSSYKDHASCSECTEKTVVEQEYDEKNWR